MVRLALTIFLGCAPLFGYAGYAQVKPPTGYSQTTVGHQYQAAANESFASKSTVLTNSALSVGGTLVTMPVAMTYAANAATVAATFSFGNPLLFATLAAGTVLYQYFKDNDVKFDGGSWKKKVTTGGEYLPSMMLNGQTTNQLSVAVSTCNSIYNPAANGYTCNVEPWWDGNGVRVYITPSQSTFWRGIPNTQATTSFVPINEQEFIDRLKDKPIPQGLPQLLPIPLPVNPPVLNPSPTPSNDPNYQPVSVPRFVPVGDPYPDPVNPGKWKQPYIEIWPSPTPDSPWRVDVRPREVTNPDSRKMTNPNRDPALKPDYLKPGDTGYDPVKDPTSPDYDPSKDPNADPTKTPKTKEAADKTPLLCEVFPDIAACAKLDTAQVVPIPDKQVDVQITKESGFGNAGSCPAPKTLALKHAAIEFSYQPYCDFATGIKPLIIALAWLAAAAMVIGVARKD